MKYRPQDEFDKIHGCVIVVINDDVPHAWSFYLYLVLFEEIDFRFIEGFKWVWILFLRERAAEYFCHLIRDHLIAGAYWAIGSECEISGPDACWQRIHSGYADRVSRPNDSTSYQATIPTRVGHPV